MRTILLAMFLFQTEETPPPLAVDVVVSGNVATLTAKSTGTSVLFLPKDGGLAQPVPAEALQPKVAVYSGKPGTYRVQVVASVKNELVFVEKQFTLAGDVVPPPGPTPPPTPPGPLPPDDGLLAKFQAAYDLEKAANKRGQVLNLIGLYLAMSDESLNPKTTTMTQLLGYLRDAGEAVLVKDLCVDLRRAIAAEVVLQLGPPDGRPIERPKAQRTFQSIADTLKRLK